MIILDRLLAGGIGFVLDKIASAVDAEMNDEGSLREELLAAQMRLELGELDEKEFVELERQLLGRLREIRDDRQAAGAVSLEQGGFEVDVTFRGDRHD
jgi:hypothetical protein